jgi:hypothetical protein
MEINPTPFIDQWSVTYIEYTAPTGQTARARIPGALGERVVRGATDRARQARRPRRARVPSVRIVVHYGYASWSLSSTQRLIYPLTPPCRCNVADVDAETASEVVVHSRRQPLREDIR